MAATGDETLKQEYAIHILEELLEAQNQSYYFGLKLNLPLHKVKSFHTTHSLPQDSLFHVITEFLNQVEPRPTWRVIIDALRSPTVGLYQLAKRLEESHFPVPPVSSTENEPAADISCVQDISPTASEGNPDTGSESDHGTTDTVTDTKTELIHDSTSSTTSSSEAGRGYSKTLISRGGSPEPNTPRDEGPEHVRDEDSVAEGHTTAGTQVCETVERVQNSPETEQMQVPGTPVRREVTYHCTELYKSESLGSSGLFGEVCKAKCDGLVCAAKTVYGTWSSGSYKDELQEVIHVLSSAKHPNIVQHLATMYDPDTHSPVFFTELCNERLTTFLDDSSPGPVPYHIQLNVSHDIALALIYLHSNGIVHGNLTGNNVLIVSGPKAKVSDFGMFKLAPINPCNQRYMPPEALAEPVSFTDKLDTFSFGVILIQIVSKEFPNPTDPIQLGRVVPETQRRYEQLRLIPENHPLKPLALQCLAPEIERPLAVQLSDSISELKQASQYTLSLHQAQRDSEIKQLEQQLEKQKMMTEYKAREAQELKIHNKQLQNVLESHQSKLQSMDREREQAAVKALQRKEKEIQQLLQLQASKSQQVLKTKDKTIHELEHSLSACMLQLEQQDRQSRQQRDISLMTWTPGVDAPVTMFRGAAAVHKNTAYFRAVHSRHIFSYQNNEGIQQWKRLPETPNTNFGLAVIDALLTTVGGSSNTLFSLTDKSEWIADVFPPMPTVRSEATCITTEQSVVVAGGSAMGECLDTVEVMNIDTKKWTTVSPLPQKGLQFSGVTYDGKLFLAGGNSAAQNSVFTCSLNNLILSAAWETGRMAVYQKCNVWKELSSLPESHSTLASLGGHLVAVGGNITASVYRYNFFTDKWETVSRMERERSSCLAVTFPEDRLVVVGGHTNRGKETDSVEILQWEPFLRPHETNSSAIRI